MRQSIWGDTLKQGRQPMKITSPTSFLSLETLYLVPTGHAHPGQPHISWKYTSSPSIGWLVGENWGWDWNSFSWCSNTIVGTIPHHSNADPLHLRSSFLHGGTGLLAGQEHFCCGFQYKVAWVFPCASYNSTLPSQEAVCTMLGALAHESRSFCERLDKSSTSPWPWFSQG